MGSQSHFPAKMRFVSVPIERTLLATGILGSVAGIAGLLAPPHTRAGGLIVIPFFCYAFILLLLGLKMRALRLSTDSALPDYTREIGATNSPIRAVPRHRWWTGRSAARSLMMIIALLMALLATWLIYDHVETLLEAHRYR